MIDVAQTSMAAGAACAIAQVTGVNDNMSQSHYHDYFELYFLDSGERYHLMDDKLFKLQAGDCILFPPQTMHRSYGDQDMEEEQHSHLDCHDECMQSLLNLIMVQLLRMNQESTGILRETRVTKVIQYIHNHYAEDITLKDLSERFYVSEYYLCREFKKSTKRTIVEYIKQTRIMNAKRLFMETDRNVTEVARETGFSNLTHFNRVFREVADVTPSEYRKRCQELHR